MHAEEYNAIDATRAVPQWWSVMIVLLAVAVFGEAIFAGAMLSGAGWAHTAHAVNARILIATTIVAGLVAAITLRRSPRGKRIGWILLSFAGLLVIQSALGALTAKGSNLLWAHVPLGIALFGIVAHLAMTNTKRA